MGTSDYSGVNKLNELVSFTDYSTVEQTDGSKKKRKIRNRVSLLTCFVETPLNLIIEPFCKGWERYVSLLLG